MLDEDMISKKELLRIYENKFLELQKLKHLKGNKRAEDMQMGVNYCINILMEQSDPQDWHDVPSDEMTLEQARRAVKDLRKKLAEYKGG